MLSAQAGRGRSTGDVKGKEERHLAFQTLIGVLRIPTTTSTSTMATKLEYIPPELLETLVSYAEPSAWKCLRLVNKALATHVTPLIFCDIEVWIQTRSLSSLQSITHAKLTKFIMDKDFWDGEYHEHRWLSGPFSNHPPDFGSLDSNVLKASLPVFGTSTRLVLQAQYRKDDRFGPIIEQNLTVLFGGMPDLEDLTLYNPPQMGLLRMHTPIQSVASTSIRTLKLQTCVLHFQGMENLIQKQAQTLKNFHLENISLESGHIVELFTSIRKHLALENFSLKGWLVEVEDDTHLYFKNEESDRHTFIRVKGRRIAAREAIESFVMRETDLFPAALLDIDSSGFTDFSRGPWKGMTVVLGASQLLDSNQVDF